MEINEKAMILVDLDALLDTRLGCIFNYDEAEAMSLLEQGFRERKSDTLDSFDTKITTEQYKELYENRGIDVLKVSRPTQLPIILCGETARLLNIAVKGGSPLEDYCVIINTHPYNLNELQIYEYVQAVKELLGEGVPVRAVSLTEESTKLVYLKMRDITDYITFDIRGWIEREFKDCEKAEDFVMEPNISVWGPQLLLSENALENVYSELPDLTEADNPFDMLKVIYAPFVNINWMSGSEFSLVDLTRTA